MYSLIDISGSMRIVGFNLIHWVDLRAHLLDQALLFFFYQGRLQSSGELNCRVGACLQETMDVAPAHRYTVSKSKTIFPPFNLVRRIDGGFLNWGYPCSSSIFIDGIFYHINHPDIGVPHDELETIHMIIFITIKHH